MVLECLGTLFLAVMWKVENVSCKWHDLAKELSMQRGKGADYMLLSAYSKMQGEGDKLKERL